MTVGNMQIVKARGICPMVGHPTDMCSNLQEDPIEQVNTASGFLGQPQMNYNTYSNTYNPRRRDHSNLSYENQQVNRPMQQNRPNFQQNKKPYPPRQQ